jgi:hypothetical protein
MCDFPKLWGCELLERSINSGMPRACPRDEQYRLRTTILAECRTAFWYNGYWKDALECRECCFGVVCGCRSTDEEGEWLGAVR